MNNLLLTNKEYRYIRKHKLNFETRYHVKLILPEVDENDGGYCANDIIFASITGEAQSIEMLKEVLKLKTDELKIGQDCVMASGNVGDSVPVITLADSDADSSSVIVLSENKNVKKKIRKKKRTFECITIPSPSNVTGASSNCNPSRKRKLTNTISSVTEIISCNIVAEGICSNNIQEKEACKIIESQRNRPSVSVNQSTIVTKKTIFTSSATITSQNANDSVVVLDEWAPIDEFIPLNNIMDKNKNKKKGKKRNKGKKISQSRDADDSVVILDDDIIELSEAAVPRPIPNDPKLLRPIVIDGSNVARHHGEAQRTFSSKGIKICVDYFLKRGHTQITAFVPLFRRHKTMGPIPTTDPIILEDLHKAGHVSFTPSKNMNGKRMTCYDDRFIVQLASTNNGIIVSNDNYKDLLDVKEFKKAIEERVLMFVFVGDTLMIPNDPLGRDGPCLDDFLSFPPETSSA